MYTLTSVTVLVVYIAGIRLAISYLIFTFLLLHADWCAWSVHCRCQPDTDWRIWATHFKFQPETDMSSLHTAGASHRVISLVLCIAGVSRRLTSLVYTLQVATTEWCCDVVHCRCQLQTDVSGLYTAGASRRVMPLVLYIAGVSRRLTVWSVHCRCQLYTDVSSVALQFSAADGGRGKKRREKPLQP